MWCPGVRRGIRSCQLPDPVPEGEDSAHSVRRSAFGHSVWRRWDCVWIITGCIDDLEAVGDLADVLVCDADRWGTVLQDHPKFAKRPEKLLVEHAEVATACSGVRENPIYVAISVGFAAHGRYGQVQVAEAVYGGIGSCRKL